MGQSSPSSCHPLLSSIHQCVAYYSTRNIAKRLTTAKGIPTIMMGFSFLYWVILRLIQPSLAHYIRLVGYLVNRFHTQSEDGICQRDELRQPHESVPLQPCDCSRPQDLFEYPFDIATRYKDDRAAVSCGRADALAKIPANHQESELKAADSKVSKQIWDSRDPQRLLSKQSQLVGTNLLSIENFGLQLPQHEITPSNAAYKAPWQHVEVEEPDDERISPAKFSHLEANLVNMPCPPPYLSSLSINKKKLANHPILHCIGPSKTLSRSPWPSISGENRFEVLQVERTRDETEEQKMQCHSRRNSIHQDGQFKPPFEINFRTRTQRDDLILSSKKAPSIASDSSSKKSCFGSERCYERFDEDDQAGYDANHCGDCSSSSRQLASQSNWEPDTSMIVEDAVDDGFYDDRESSTRVGSPGSSSCHCDFQQDCDKYNSRRWSQEDMMKWASRVANDLRGAEQRRWKTGGFSPVRRRVGRYASRAERGWSMASTAYAGTHDE